MFTTLNVQHLESLNDVVGGITGINVWETVPDTFFDQADEVVLVDVSGRRSARAARRPARCTCPSRSSARPRNFFRKGNLMALRELALRRTADRVEDDVQAYRSDKSIERVWKTEDSLLCCIGPGPGGEDVVRSAARLAAQLGVDWTAVYVETPALQRLPARERERILQTVKLAQEFGAKTAILAGSDPAAQIVEYARTHNCSKVVVGRARRRAAVAVGARHWRSGSATLAPDIDLIEVGRGDRRSRAASARARRRRRTDPRRDAKRLRYLWALLACVATTLVATPLLPYFDLANIVMLFLLTVVLVALKWGRGPAVLAAFVSVAAFDFFFVPPRFRFAVSDFQYLLTFAVMLAVALIIGQMTAGLRYQARVASYREERARVALRIRARHVEPAADRRRRRGRDAGSSPTRSAPKVAMLVPDAQDRLPLVARDGGPGSRRRRRRAVGVRQGAARGRRHRHARRQRIPVPAAARADAHARRARDQARQSAAAARARAAAAARHVRRARPRSRSSACTTSKSRSRRCCTWNRSGCAIRCCRRCRTTCARRSRRCVGLAESLALTQAGAVARAQLETAHAIADEARRMSALVNNLLDMARIESGEVKLRRQWQPFEEVVGSALKAAQAGARAATASRSRSPRDLPLVEFDATLIERVLYNLLENAGKYTPPGRVDHASPPKSPGGELVVRVSDTGPGIPKGQEEAIFEKFTRGARESTTPGVGLGLAISRAIVEAHHGKICGRRTRRPAARASRFTLPLGTPPGSRRDEAPAMRAGAAAHAMSR